MSGSLYLVGIPIGNLDDITLRAVKTLQSVDTIVAEDTRKAKRLLSDLNITGKRFISHGNHNEHQSVDGVMNLLLSGENAAYISDAGMPCISDPGFLLVRAAVEKNIDFKIIPGVTAATTAIAGCGLSSDRFYFHGFLPRKSGERIKTLENLAHLPATLIFYEAPHRVLDTLKDLSSIWRERGCSIGRELTKTYEEFVRGSVQSVYDEFSSRNEILGEFVILVEGASEDAHMQEEDIDTLINQKLEQGAKAKEIRDELAEVFSGSKKELYTKILSLKSNL